MKKHPYIEKLVDKADSYIKKETGRAAELEVLNAAKASGDITPNEYDKKSRELADRQGDIFKEYLTGIADVVNDYSEAVDNWAKLKGSDMSDDAALFSSTINLTQKELEDMIERHRENYTMTRVIADYIDANSDTIGKRYPELKVQLLPLPEQKIKAMNEAKDFFDTMTPLKYNIYFKDMESNITMNGQTVSTHVSNAWNDYYIDSGWHDILGDGSELNK